MVEAIGGNGSVVSQTTNNNTIAQEDFIRLFVAQLNNQDPLKPVDNSQFLAQMAQFTNLEQTRLMNGNMTNMLAMSSSDQGLGLLGKQVQVNSGNTNFDGTVEGVHFKDNGLTLTIKNTAGTFLNDVSLASVKIVQK